MTDPTSEALPSLLDVVSEHTDLTYIDLAHIGAALLTAVTTVARLGWASPGSWLDYADPLGDPHSLIVRDFVAWTSHRKSMAEGCGERLRAFVEQSGWTTHVLIEANQLLYQRRSEGPA